MWTERPRPKRPKGRVTDRGASWLSLPACGPKHRRAVEMPSIRFIDNPRNQQWSVCKSKAVTTPMDRIRRARRLAATTGADSMVGRISLQRAVAFDVTHSRGCRGYLSTARALWHARAAIE